MKKLIALCLALVLTLSLVGCSDKTMTFDIGNATQIEIKSGLTGDEVIIEDSEFVKGVTENINSLTFEKMGKLDGVGYAYMLTWMDETDSTVASITITEENGYQISHDGYYYKVGADLAIDMQPILEMLNIALSSSPAPDTPNANIPSVIYNGKVYSTTGKQMPVEVDESAYVGEITSVVPLSQWPTEEGQANFGEVGSPYAVTSDGFVVLMDNEWTLFESLEAKLIYGEPQEPSDSDFINGEGEPLDIEGISQERAEEIGLEQCKVNYDYIRTEFNHSEKRWSVEFWESIGKVPTQTILIDTEGNVINVLYAE